MNQKKYTKAIVLSRVDYSETDRVLALLTPQYGKLHLLAKGVRKEKSKLAGGIELFCEVEVGYITGKGELGTLISSSLIKFYSIILQDINKVQLMYQALKTIDKTTEDNVEQEYYDLLLMIMTLANEKTTDYKVLGVWYKAQLLNLHGHQPNLNNDVEGKSLKENTKYIFDFNSMSFKNSVNGNFGPNHIKFLRLLFNEPSDKTIFRLKETKDIVKLIDPLIDAMMKSTLSI